ncbi:hypothetical protein EV121DRAFT_289213 [Schizophyllum commune]
MPSREGTLLREGTKDPRSRSHCVPAAALNLPANPPPRTPTLRPTAGETMPARGTKDEIHTVHDVPKPPSIPPHRAPEESSASTMPSLKTSTTILFERPPRRLPCASSRPGTSKRFDAALKSKGARGTKGR